MADKEQPKKDTESSFISRPYIGKQRDPEAMEEELKRLTREVYGESQDEEEKEETNDEPVDDADTSFVSKDGKKEPSQDWEVRYSELQKFSNRKINELVEQNRELKEKFERAAKEQGIKPIVGEMSDEDFEKVVKTNPQLVSAMETVVSKRVSRVEAELEEERKETRRVRRQLGHAKIKEAHPDWDDLKDDPAFMNFLEELPEEWTDPVFDPNNFNPQPTIHVLDLYKVKQQKSSDSEKEQKKTPVFPEQADTGAAVVKVSGSPTPAENVGEKKIWKESEINKLSRKDYLKYDEEISQALREGRIEYDLSKK